ncbi:hypothetical protein BK138_32270 [Paenibacillus rhizosphaerae]|uniref:DUF4878 domain-containing protein n=1 Tax=Paenibacillus rhizosphaerae TaxID=297318 RepID=A0A1R1E688_9BACL|nr:hypothetical protein BK138_32270 [Paenibacillus rhizosphaerae]
MAAAEIQDFVPSFLKLYVPFDSGITGEESTVQLSKMKPFVTDKLYQQLSEIKRRGTLTITKTEVMDIALLPAEIGEKVQYWNATINVGFTDHNGKKETSVLPYILKVSYIYGKWKVDDVGGRTGAWNP